MSSVGTPALPSLTPDGCCPLSPLSIIQHLCLKEVGNIIYYIISLLIAKEIKKCPVCGREVIKENEIAYQNKEGDGRAHGVGGSVCDDCPHCYGSVDWCPFMD